MGGAFPGKGSLPRGGWDLDMSSSEGEWGRGELRLHLAVLRAETLVPTAVCTG